MEPNGETPVPRAHARARAHHAARACAARSHPMDAFLEGESYGMDMPRRGEVRKGTIARIADNDILVDIGAKSEGVIPARELEQMPPEERATLAVGQEITVYVIHSGERDGNDSALAGPG